MIAAYFDESGIHDGSVAVAFSGYSSSPDIWQKFSIEWMKRLDDFGLKFFHMHEFVARVEPFDKLGEAERVQLMRSLIACIIDHDIAGTTIALKRDDFSVVMPGISGRASDPYYMLMMRAMVDVLLYASLRKERVLFTFHRRQKVVELAGLLHDAILDVHPWLASVISDQTVFGSTREHIPLQAADLLAYESYRRACNLHAPERKSYTALRPSFGELTIMSVAELGFYSLDPRIRRAVEDIMGLS